MKYTIFLLLLCLTFSNCTQVENKETKNEDSTNVIPDMTMTSLLGKESVVYTTASETELRLEKTNTVTFENASQPLENEVSVFVNPKKSFQSFLGIGGAITDASAEVFAQLPVEKQEEFLTAYYDKEKGIGYSLSRTPIHSCDFSSGSYTYIEEGDKDLNTFSIDHDKNYKIPLIKKAIEAGLKLGCKMLKFFPAGAAGGVNMLKNLAAPYGPLGVRFCSSGRAPAQSCPTSPDRRCRKASSARGSRSDGRGRPKPRT